jgi:hypothetical protein
MSPLRSLDAPRDGVKPLVQATRGGLDGSFLAQAKLDG